MTDDGWAPVSLGHRQGEEENSEEGGSRALPPVRARAAKARVVVLELAGEHGYLPLSAGYLATYALADPDLADAATVEVVLEHCQEPPSSIVAKVLGGGPVDVMAVSCQGWSMPCVDRVIETVKARYPATWVVVGGAHVSHQPQAALVERPAVDVLVNGEGELTFHELIRAYLAVDDGRPPLDDVLGISYRANSEIRTNPDRPRLKDLDRLPSPYLGGVLDTLVDGAGTVMFETNRGCPYRCSFCYWGQAVGQRLHRFSRGWLIAEMEHLARRERTPGTSATPTSGSADKTRISSTSWWTFGRGTATPARSIATGPRTRTSGSSISAPGSTGAESTVPTRSPCSPGHPRRSRSHTGRT